jgi:hypothetical protein
MPSELSASIAKRMLVAKAQGKLDQEYSSALELLRPEIDGALREVREVLTALIDFSNGVIASWEVRPSAVEALNLNRARAIRDRLSIEDHSNATES